MKISIKLPLLIASIGAASLLLAAWIARSNTEALMQQSAAAGLQNVADGRSQDLANGLDALTRRFASVIEEGSAGSGDTQAATETMRQALTENRLFEDFRVIPDDVPGMDLRVTAGEVDGTRSPFTFVGHAPAIDATIAASADPLLIEGVLADRADLMNSGTVRIFAGAGPHPLMPEGFVSAHTVVTHLGQRFTIVASRSDADVLAPLARFDASFLQQGGIALIFVVAIGLLLARTITVPLSRLSRSMNCVAQRNYRAEIHDRRRADELGGLARQLDELRASLLHAANSERELAFKGACFDREHAALMLMASDLTVLYVNDAMHRFMRDHEVALERHSPKFGPDVMVGRPLDLIFPGAFRMQEALRDQPTYTEELHLGAARFRVECMAVASEEEVTFGYLIRWRDVTDQRRHEGLQSALETLVPSAEFSTDGRLQSANAPFRDWTGQNETDVGRRWDDIFIGDNPFEPGTPISARPFALSATVSPRRTNAVSLHPIFGDSGVVENYVMVALPDSVLEPGLDGDMQRALAT
ncbi:MAG: HAMP domain-containing protein [Pseudomonadota bacterium]